MEVKTIEACCEPLLAGALTEAEANELAASFKVLADPARLRLFSMVASMAAGEACACELVEPLGRSQPSTSPTTMPSPLTSSPPTPPPDSGRGSVGLPHWTRHHGLSTPSGPAPLRATRL